ncbi:hypothetical protein K788_00035980 [Paraburkholderia caribensis MBA4]|uniref:Uncharacterized protein n=1 Tax=Paraburkholderia caribensis MBA4 TaxID=1323664 RepID=A0A0P0R6B2_9BURK|nr:hypothetical protein K788_00035980 [Paraburkholderia caribensis MBA4]
MNSSWSSVSVKSGLNSKARAKHQPMQCFA